MILKLNYLSGVKCFQLYRGFALAVRPLQVELQGIKGISYPVSHDYDSFENVVPFLSTVARPRDRVCVVEHPDLRGCGKMVRKIAELPVNWISSDGSADSYEACLERQVADEINMQRHVAALGLGIAPKIIGLVTEQSRGVIGFLMEYNEGARSFHQLRK
ncbi:hypothetical protein PG994_009308 [Apiospora phragmitis]|uniref:Uncharacterized protein n=1 Tax=Apiospora phragmitis TaxID=2905665 RepID=A0ABR1UIX0_9PEZI